jgi:aryl-alcohol dehydrogenase-like predicted oxidoreductase
MSITYRPLGRTGLKVSPLCLGTMNFGPFTSEEDSFAIMDRALELGINFFDTADVYGRKKGEGVTESILGRWFAQGGRRRERVVLATKVYGDMDQHENDPNLRTGLSSRKIIRSCEASLRRMQTDWIDLYQMHHIDRNCPFDEIWQAMETLVRQGKIVYVGSSNFAGWDIATANQTAKQRSFLGLVCEQSIYNLMNRNVELEVLPACRAYGLGVIPWSPLNRGLLGGILKKTTGGRRNEPETARQVEKHHSQLEKYEALCDELGASPADVAIAWLLKNPVVTSPIIGPRTMDQLAGNVRSLDLKLSDETMRKLDEIWPGPGGEAPKAYAW